MSETPILLLLVAFLGLIVLSAFFSSSETGMMALNRYRLRHLSRQRNRGAQLAERLLEQPDRLIGIILLGNNFVNILATAIATVLAIRLFGEAGIAIATVSLTAIILIFAEVAPKTLAAMHPERVAFPAAFVLTPLLRVLYPVVWLITWIANQLLRPLGYHPEAGDGEGLSQDELRTAVTASHQKISKRNRDMLVGVLDLESATVDDIMIHRNEINGLDLDDPEKDLLAQILTSQHTQLPVYRGDINNIEGVVHVRRLLEPIYHDEFTVERLIHSATDPYFTPLGTPLTTQLRNFQRQQERIGLIVDEYGDIQGLVTLEDILEEIVGEFTTDPAVFRPEIHPQPDGTFLVEGAAAIREINRATQLRLPVDGPKTLNGVIIEHMEAIPEPGTSLLIGGYPVEIVQATDQAVKIARINPVRPRRARLLSVHADD